MRSKKEDSLPGTSIRNLIGKTFGRLTVVDYAGRDKHDLTLWKCLCVCTGTKTARGQELTRGDTQSCGCIHREVFKKITTTHGCSYEDWYPCWRAMHDRTSNPKSESYADYGAKGITIEDPLWRDMSDPSDFIKHMGPRPSRDHSIDRIDGTRGYSKSNCKWSDRGEQQNNRACCRRITIGKLTLTVTQWSKKTGVPRNVIYLRLDAGWDAVRAITTPVNNKNPLAGYAKGLSESETELTG